MTSVSLSQDCTRQTKKKGRTVYNKQNKPVSSLPSKSPRGGPAPLVPPADLPQVRLALVLLECVERVQCLPNRPGGLRLTPALRPPPTIPTPARAVAVPVPLVPARLPGYQRQREQGRELVDGQGVRV